MILQEHTEAARRGWIQRDRRPIWQVADNRFGMDRTRQHGEKWQLSRTPWAKQILEDVQDDDVREVVLMAGSQCAKTAPMLIALCWGMAHRPVPRLWITGNDDLARDASQERIQPSLERCPDAKPFLQNNRLDKTTWKIRTQLSTLDIAGAQASAVLEQNPYAEIFGDEVRQWPAGSLQKVEKRQRSYSDAKRYLFSTPNTKGDEFHQRFLAGTQCEWVWPCMDCNHEQQLKWEGLKYGSDSKKTEDGSDGTPSGGGNIRWGDSPHDQVGVYVVCEKCGWRHYDQPTVRRHIVENGRWRSTNEQPNAGVVSYHWNALLPPWVRWQDLVDEWRRANDLKKLGNIEPLKVFICETLGEPWEDRADETVFTRRMELLRARVKDYEGGSPWEDEAVHPRLGHRQRFIGADVQSDVIYWRARMFGRAGTSRGIAFGRCYTFDELEQIRRDLQIPSHYLFIDSGFRTQEVYRACARWGWAACKGEDKEWFSKATARGSVRNVFNQSEAVPHYESGAAYSNKIPLFIWSNPSVKDMLELYITGEAGDWTVERLSGPNGDEYLLQVIGEERRREINNRTGAPEYNWHKIHDDHWRDCELMVLVAAMASGVLASGNVDSDRKANARVTENLLPQPVTG